MASKTNVTLSRSWAELADGACSIILVTGGVFWLYVGTSSPSDDTAYFPVTADEKYYSYPGTQKVYGKVPNLDIPTIVAPVEIS
jgi:hypothetical protein